MGDVDACCAPAVTASLEIVHPLTDEPWGACRSSARDPDGHGVDVVGHARS